MGFVLPAACCVGRDSDRHFIAPHAGKRYVRSSALRFARQFQQLPSETRNSNSMQASHEVWS